MISLLLDPSSEHLKSYIPPFSGTWTTLPPQLLPDDTLQDSQNVTILQGRLRSRLGHVRYTPFNFTTHVLGSFMFVDVQNTKYPLASTATNLYRFTADWADVTGTVLTGNENAIPRMTSIQINTSVYLLYANGVNDVKFMEQNSTLQNITPYTDPDTDITSTIPTFTDICTSFSRIVGITPPYTVAWCDVLNDEYLSFRNWPALNQVVLSDTEDSLVAIRSLSTLGLAVYKEGNIFVGFPQSGSQANAFRFEHRGEYEGPAGVSAIVNVNGAHVYMTPTGRIGYFDGSTQEWICDGIWPFLQDDLDTAYANRISGVYNYRTSEIYFYYPRLGDEGLCKGMVIIDTPYPTAGINTYSYFLGNTELDVRNGLSVRLFNAATSPLIFAQNTESKYLSFSLEKDSYADDSRSFECSMTTGLFKPESLQNVPISVQGDIVRPIVEVLATRDSERGLVNVSALHSNLLESNGTLSQETETLDLTRDVISEYIGYNESGSYIGVKLEWDSDAKVEYKGCDVYGRRNI